MKYDAKYFIDKFSVIPEDQWFIRMYRDEGDQKRCALGHCGMAAGKPSPPEAIALIQLFDEHRLGLVLINDGESSIFPPYLYPTPKSRILAALREIHG